MKTLFSTEEAAEHLGLTLAAMKYHTFVAKNITGQLVGNSLVFTKEQLDHFNQNKRPPGRPKGKKNE